MSIEIYKQTVESTRLFVLYENEQSLPEQIVDCEYCVVWIDHPNKPNIEELLEWCTNNLRGHWVYDKLSYEQCDNIWVYMNSDDYMLFKLRWL